MLDKNGLTEIFAIYYYIELHQMMEKKQEMDLSAFK